MDPKVLPFTAQAPGADLPTPINALTAWKAMPLDLGAYPPASPLVPSCTGGAGILTGFPSATPFGFTLGPG